MARNNRPLVPRPQRTLRQKLARLVKFLVFVYLVIVCWANWQEWIWRESRSHHLYASRYLALSTPSDPAVDEPALSSMPAPFADGVDGTPNRPAITANSPANGIDENPRPDALARDPSVVVIDPPSTSVRSRNDLLVSSPTPTAAPRVVSTPTRVVIATPRLTPTPFTLTDLRQRATPSSSPLRTASPVASRTPAATGSPTPGASRTLLSGSSTPAVSPKARPRATPSATPESLSETTMTVDLPPAMASVAVYRAPNEGESSIRLTPGEQVQALAENPVNGWQHIRVRRKGLTYACWVEQRYLKLPRPLPDDPGDLSNRKASL